MNEILTYVSLSASLPRTFVLPWVTAPQQGCLLLSFLRVVVWVAALRAFVGFMAPAYALVAQAHDLWLVAVAGQGHHTSV